MELHYNCKLVANETSIHWNVHTVYMVVINYV